MQTPTPEAVRAQRARLLRLLLLAAGGIGVLYLLGRSCGPSSDSPQAASSSLQDPASTRNGGRSADKEGFDELSIGQEYQTSVASQGHRVSTLEAEAATLRRELETLRTELGKAVQRQASAHEASELSRLAELAKVSPTTPTPGSEPDSLKLPATLPLEAPRSEPPSRGIRLLQFGPPSEETPSVSKKALRIPTASAGEATVLNGVFAPTGGEPSPIRLRLDAAILGPSRSRVPLQGAILIGKAAGDANATRVTVELVSFSYVKAPRGGQGGPSIEVPVRGYVVGDDGMEGIPGTYLYRLEEQVPLAIVTEGVAGLTSALAERETTRSVTPFGGATSVVTGDPLKYAGLKAAAGTSSKVGEILAERMRELRPAVWTPPDKRVKVVFLEGVTLEGIDPLEAHDGEDHPFRDLDLDR